MPSSFTTTDKRQVFLVCRPVFTGIQAQVRKEKAVRKIVRKHRLAFGQSLIDLGLELFITILKHLLEQRVFESEVEARAQFPELYAPSPTQNTRLAESESKAAYQTAASIGEIERLESQGDEADLELRDDVDFGSVVELVNGKGQYIKHRIFSLLTNVRHPANTYEKFA